jgi:hypothetical protein
MFSLASLLPVALCLFAVPQEQGMRQIVPEEFIKSRPAKSTTSSTKRPGYRQATGKPNAAGKSSDAQQLGLTIWRLRRAATGESGMRIIVQQENDAEEWQPERVEAGAPMRMGERIRFSFESPQAGYLYVIDREQYADGRLGEPFLIFPTTRTRGGDNQVAPGRVIEIPGQDDRPNYFTLRQSRLDQVGEQLTVIVTARPLEGLSIGAKSLALSAEQVAEWEKSWGAQVEQFEMTGGAGKPWTKAEQEAGADLTRQLTQDDPGPQTVFRVAATPGSPILVKVGLRYGKPKPRNAKSIRQAGGQKF